MYSLIKKYDQLYTGTVLAVILPLVQFVGEVVEGRSDNKEVGGMWGQKKRVRMKSIDTIASTLS